MKMKAGSIGFKGLAGMLAGCFLATMVGADLLRCRKSEAAELGLPQPGTLLAAGVVHQAPIMKGVRFNPNDPLNLEFIFDSGSEKAVDQSQARQLIEYFIAGLLVPESDLWVNLSPYESERVVPQALGETALGRDMLATDYVLKQLASSLTHPDSETGKAYWSSAEGSALSKVWVMPDAANMIDADTAGYIIDATLKVMTEADYTALQESGLRPSSLVPANEVSDRPSAMSALLPAITSDVNEGKNFETLRQIYHSLLLATWFKKNFMNTFYKQYFDSTGVEGVQSGDPEARKKIYDLYVSAFKKGAYDVLRTSVDSIQGQSQGKKVKRRYFSGGAVMTNLFKATQYQPVNETTRSGFVRSIDGNSFACSAVVLHTNIKAPIRDVLSDMLKEFRYLDRHGYFPGLSPSRKLMRRLLQAINKRTEHDFIIAMGEYEEYDADFHFHPQSERDQIEIAISRVVSIGGHRLQRTDTKLTLRYDAEKRMFYKSYAWNGYHETEGHKPGKGPLNTLNKRSASSAVSSEVVINGAILVGFALSVVMNFVYRADANFSATKGKVRAWEKIEYLLMRMKQDVELSYGTLGGLSSSDKQQMLETIARIFFVLAKAYGLKKVIEESSWRAMPIESFRYPFQVRDILVSIGEFDKDLRAEPYGGYEDKMRSLVDQAQEIRRLYECGAPGYFWDRRKHTLSQRFNSSSAVQKNVGGISLREAAQVKVAPYAGPLAMPAGLKGAMSVFTLSLLRQVAAADVVR